MSKGIPSKGVILNVYVSFDGDYEADILPDIGDMVTVHSDDILSRLKPKALGVKYKYVLKTMLLDEIFPKDHDKYAKVRVVK